MDQPTTAAPKKPRKNAPATGMQAAPPEEELDALGRWVKRAKANPLLAIMLMLWKARLQQPDMYVQITERDIAGFEDSVNYLHVKPTAVIHREPGIPAQPGIPQSGNRRATPAREAIPPKPYAVVMLVELGKDGLPTMNMIKPIENNEADYDRSLEVAAQRRARDRGPDLAVRLINASRTGDFSSSDLQDAAECLQILCRAT